MSKKGKSTPPQQEHKKEGLPVPIWFIAILAIATLAIVFGPSLMAGTGTESSSSDGGLNQPPAGDADAGVDVVPEEVETSTETTEVTNVNPATPATTTTTGLDLTKMIGPEKLPEYGAMESAYAKVSHKTTFTLEKSGIKGFVSTNSELSHIGVNFINPSGMKESVILVQLLNNNGNVVFSKQDPITGEKFSYRKWYPDEFGGFKEESAIKNTNDLSKVTHWRILIYE